MKPIFNDPLLDDPTPRALDAIVTCVGQPRDFGRRQVRAAWVLVTRDNEPLEDFFLLGAFGDEPGARGEDPAAWICRGIGADGTLKMGRVDLDIDRFVSALLRERGRWTRSSVR